jgi:glutathione S-transferase
MLKLWGRTNSINVMKVLWLCDELGIAYERVDAGMAFGVVGTPEYKAMNPNSRVPTIDDDGFVLWESHSILRYLAAKHAPGKLMPLDLPGRADCERWMDWVLVSVNTPMTPLFWQLVRTPADKRDSAVIERARVESEQMFRLLDGHLADRDYLTGSAFSLADIPAGCFVHRWLALPNIERPKLAALEAWYARLLKRPAYAKWVATPLT